MIDNGRFEQLKHAAQLRATGKVTALVLGTMILAVSPVRAADDGVWRELPPVQRVGHALLYDGAHDRLVMFGGWDGARCHNDVWVLPLGPGGTWSQLDVAGAAPEPRLGCAAVLDSLGDRMVIFGGERSWSGPELGDTWELSLGATPTWMQLAAGETSPSARSWPASCLDIQARRVIVAGGRMLPGSDAWAFDLSAGTWTPLTTIGWSAPAGPPRPWPNFTQGGSYDPVHHAMIAWGDSLWMLLLSGTPRWQPMKGWAYESYVFYDARRSQMVGAGGGNVITEAFPADTNESWASWNSILPGGLIPWSFSATQSCAYDPIRDRVLLVGGSYDNGDIISSATWAVPLAGPPSLTSLFGELGGPEPRFGPTVAFDPSTNDLFVSGSAGDMEQFAGPWRVWALSLVNHSWSAFSDSGQSAPVAPSGTGVWDPVRGRLLVLDSQGLWSRPAAAGQSWPAIGPALAPPLNCVYDPAGDRLIASSGGGVLPRLQLWALPLAAPSVWAKLGDPVPGSGPMILDPIGNRVIVFAGTDTMSHAGNLTWELPLASPTSWQLVPASGPPPIPFDALSAVYDPIRRRMVVIGPPPDLVTLNEWALSLDRNPTWAQLRPGVGPPSLSNVNAIYDPAHDRMLVLSSGNSGMALWALEWSGAPTPVTVSVVEAQAATGHVSVVWAVATAGEACTVDRARGAGSAWEVVASVTADGTGRVSYEDRAVESGSTYGYRLRLGAGATGGEVWVDVPDSPVFAIESPRPNPTTDGLSLSVTLPDAAPASLEVTDITGRRMAAQDLGGLGAGRHTIHLSRPGELKPGLYFVRLRRGSHSLTARACVLR